MDIKKVGVIGSGSMGSGIAQVTATRGYDTTLRDISEGILNRAKGVIEKSISRFIEKGTLQEADRRRIFGQLHFTTELEQLSDCDLVIEAITENLEAKRSLFSSLDKICKRDCIFATNTSSLTIVELMTATNRRDKFLGLHFFNPVPMMPLVEVVRAISTDPAIYEKAVEFVTRLGKTPIRAQDRPGFVVNRLLVPYLLDAIRALEEGAGTVEDIDSGMKLGCGYPMGPFTLLDFVGLDTTYYIANIMFDEFKEKRFAPPPLLKRMFLAGHWGRKTGKGFYDYTKKE